MGCFIKGRSKGLLLLLSVFYIPIIINSCTPGFWYQHDLINGDYEKAKETLERLLRSTNDKSLIWGISNDLGVVYSKLNNRVMAKKYYIKSIEAWPERGYYGYLNLADLSYYNGQTKEAFEYSKMAKRLVENPDYEKIEKTGYDIDFMKKLVLAGESFYRMKVNFDQLRTEIEFENYKKATEIAEGIINTKYYISIGLNPRGHIIDDIAPGSIASINGLIVGDKILAIENESFNDNSQANQVSIYNWMGKCFDKYGSTVNITIFRNGRKIPINIKLAYPEIDQAKMLLQETKAKLAINSNKNDQKSFAPMIRVLEPKSAQNVKISPNQMVTFTILASDRNSIKEVTVNENHCNFSEPDLVDQSILPGNLGKYTIALPLHQGKNIYQIVAINEKGIKTIEKIEIEGYESNSRKLSKLYDHMVAVVIGIDNYSNFSSLEYAVNDAKSVCEQISKMGFDNIIPIYNKEATRARIMRVLSDELPGRLGENDGLLVYFAGHGLTEELPGNGQEGYIAPVDIDRNNYRGTSISMTSIHQMIKNYKAKHILFVFDSCYSGLGLKRSGGSMEIGKRFIESVSQKKATQIITAGGKNEKVHEVNGHGLFTRAFLFALEGKIKEIDADFLVASDIAQAVRKIVTEETNGLQNPLYGWITGEGDFVFYNFEK